MKRSILMIVVCGGLLLAGCGGGDDSSTDAAKSGAGVSGDGSENAAATESPAQRPAAIESSGGGPAVVLPTGPPPKELEVKNLKEGSGGEAQPGDEVTMRYIGVTYKTGKKFYSSWDKGQSPFTFKVGARTVIAGWDQGVKGMKVGGRRELIIPPDLAYGEKGATDIPPNEALVLVVDLLKVKQASG